MDANNEHLWKQYRECTEESYRERDKIVERYPLITVWNLFHNYSTVGFEPIPTFNIKDEIGDGGPQVLDTYRKVVDRAPAICRAAYDELVTFWGIEPRPPKRLDPTAARRLSIKRSGRRG